VDVVSRYFEAMKESYTSMRYEATNRRLTEKLVVISRKQVSLLWARVPSNALVRERFVV
jgi:hypothetical protein